MRGGACRSEVVQRQELDLLGEHANRLFKFSNDGLIHASEGIMLQRTEDTIPLVRAELRSAR